MDGLRHRGGDQMKVEGQVRCTLHPPRHSHKEATFLRLFSCVSIENDTYFCRKQSGH